MFRRRVVYYSVIVFSCVLFLELCSAALCVYSLSCGCRVPSAGSASAAKLNSRRGIAELYIRRLGRRQLKQDQHYIFLTVWPSFLLIKGFLSRLCAGKSCVETFKKDRCLQRFSVSAFRDRLPASVWEHAITAKPWRRMRDSNPRNIAVLRFSKPVD